MFYPARNSKNSSFYFEKVRRSTSVRVFSIQKRSFSSTTIAPLVKGVIVRSYLNISPKNKFSGIFIQKRFVTTDKVVKIGAKIIQETSGTAAATTAVTTITPITQADSNHLVASTSSSSQLSQNLPKESTLSGQKHTVIPKKLESTGSILKPLETTSYNLPQTNFTKALPEDPFEAKKLEDKTLSPSEIPEIQTPALDLIRDKIIIKGCSVPEKNEHNKMPIAHPTIAVCLDNKQEVENGNGYVLGQHFTHSPKISYNDSITGKRTKEEMEFFSSTLLILDKKTGQPVKETCYSSPVEIKKVTQCEKIEENTCDPKAVKQSLANIYCAGHNIVDDKGFPFSPEKKQEIFNNKVEEEKAQLMARKVAMTKSIAQSSINSLTSKQTIGLTRNILIVPSGNKGTGSSGSGEME